MNIVSEMREVGDRLIVCHKHWAIPLNNSTPLLMTKNVVQRVQW